MKVFFINESTIASSEQIKTTCNVFKRVVNHGMQTNKK